MSILINATPLYNYLKYCESSKLEKIILDCGAGGSLPPLALFYEFGYDVFGIDNSSEQIMAAEKFSDKNKMNFNLINSDMTSIPYEDESFSFVYSFNTSVHIPKKDFMTAVNNFKRVLKKDGLLFLNFLNNECDTFGIGNEISEGEYFDEDSDTLFVHYSQKEIIKLIEGFEVLYSEEKRVKRKFGDSYIKSGFYDYIVKKI
jgi:ubiquinone/menaquinone biosynthesis C-methylase UbiE